MPEQYTASLEWLQQYPELFTLLSASLLVLVAWIANWIVKRILVRGIYKALSATPLGADPVVREAGVVARLANIVPALIIAIGIMAVPGVPPDVVIVVRNVCSAVIVLVIALSIGKALWLVNTLYQRKPDARIRPIKGYIQVVTIIVYVVAVILGIAALVDRSPLILLSGLGAMAAVLILVFQDTLLSLVASVQISSGDIIRVGDWVEMPGLNADGDVIDIALHTVKIQNWDKTITTVPTRKFITDSFKNWRGMSESGGRRIKRALMLDQQSVHFLDAGEVEHLHRFNLLDEYLTEKERDIEGWNRKLEKRGKEVVNTRRVTNIGTFRAYVERYLRSHPGVHTGMTLIVRQLDPTADGLPLEIYCFTSTTDWVPYEAIQSDIFDHMLAILPEFNLRVFQHPSGTDMRQMGTEGASDRPEGSLHRVDGALAGEDNSQEADSSERDS